MDFIVPLDGGELDGVLVLGRELADGLSLEHVSVTDLELDDFGLPVGEGIDLESGRQGEDVIRHPGRLVLGVDDHGKAQLLPEVVDFPAIVGIDIEGNDVYKQEIAKYAEMLNK